MAPRRSSQHQRRNRIVAAVLVCSLLGGWWLLRGDDTEPKEQDRATQPGTSADTAPAKARKKRAKVTFDKPRPAPASLTGLPELPELPGLPGGSLAGDVPPLDLVITLTSNSPIGTVGWVIPTSKDNSDGRADGVGRTWTLRTSVYGRPDYARVFLQAGATGDPIQCVVTVEGRVTERQATVGPYGQLMCQG